MAQSKSNLTRYAIYHMWTNHAETMVHYKFRFLHTLNIEREWLHLKTKFALIKHARTPQAIQDWCNVFSMHKSVLKPEGRYDFWLQMIKYYYWDSVRTFRNSCVLLEADTIYPNIMALDHIENIKEMPNLKETLNSINSMVSFNTKDLN